MNLTRQNWPLGWVPTQSDINGNPDGLLRMDSLQQDELGSIGLARGMQEISNFNSPIIAIFSKIIQGIAESIWVGLYNYQMIRSLSGTFGDSFYLGGGGDDFPVFGAGFGFVFALAGTQRYKDDGSSTLILLGILDPGKPIGGGTQKAPTVTAISQPFLELVIGTPIIIEGTAFGGTGVTTDPTTLRGTTQFIYGSPLDTTNIGGNGPSLNPGGDQFFLTIELDDSSNFSDVIVSFILGNTTTITDYYTFDFQVNGDTQFVLGQSQQSTLSVWRDNFTRQGSDSTLDWTTVSALQVTFISLSQANALSIEGKFAGGSTGGLNGVYVYMEVDVNQTPLYQGKSSPSLQTLPVFVINGAAQFTPATTYDPQVNLIQIFRMSIGSSTDPNIQQILAQNPNTPDLLNTFYFVGTTQPGVPFLDTVPDLTLLETNILPNLFLVSVQDIPDAIIAVEGPYFDRMLYVSRSFIYLSDTLDPDAIDSRFTIKAFGDPTEENLWLKKLTNGVLILGTTKNLYELSGTLVPLPDGTVDITIIPIGENYPPLSSDVCAANGIITYVASDGFRYTTGSNSQILSTQLNLLFQGVTRFDFPAVAIYPGNVVRYPIAIAHGKIFASLYMMNGTRYLFIYNIARQTFAVQYTDPVALFGTQSDRILAGYGAGGSAAYQNNGLWDIEKTTDGGFYDSSGALINGYAINFLTVFDHNQQPRNRKNLFTLKIIADTGGDQVDINMAQDGDSLMRVGTINTSGLQTSYIPLYNLNKPVLDSSAVANNNFRLQIQLLDHNLLTHFKLDEITIEYEPYPEQLNYLVIQPTNFGSYARKRWTSFAYVINTLGNLIDFIPDVDNVALVPFTDTFATKSKQTHITFFDEETIGTDMGGVFIATTTTGVFEYYGPNLEETISEKLPTPCTFLVIPANNYGTPNRKRHTSYKFQIITRGANVVFTPIVDGVSYPTAIFNTTTKTTVEYFFPTNQIIPGEPGTTQTSGDVIGVDIGGTLASTGSYETQIPFEFYGVVVPQQVEQLPDRLQYFRIPNTNLGVASRKRIRTIPMVIDTYGQPVVFTPILDGVLQGTSSTFTTLGKITVYHYFTTDVFPTDIGGQLSSDGSGQPFEFYGFGEFEKVEVLPVPKMFDQVGPVRYERIAKAFIMRVRLISTGDTSINYSIFKDDNSVNVPANNLTDPNAIYSGSFAVVPFTDKVYEIQFPHNINGAIFRIVFGPTSFPFHRYDVMLKLSQSGMATDSQWVPIR